MPDNDQLLCGVNCTCGDVISIPLEKGFLWPRHSIRGPGLGFRHFSHISMQLPRDTGQSDRCRQFDHWLLGTQYQQRCLGPDLDGGESISSVVALLTENRSLVWE